MIRVMMVLLVVLILGNLLFLPQTFAQKQDAPFTKDTQESSVNYNPWSVLIYVLLGSLAAFMVFRGVRPV